MAMPGVYKELPMEPKKPVVPPSWSAMQPTPRAPRRQVQPPAPLPQQVTMQRPTITPPSSVATGTPPSLSALTPPTERVQYDAAKVKAGQDAAFARAKDEAAMIAQSAMRGMQGALRSRGMGGAGYEAGAIGNVVMRGADQVGEASRAKMIQDAELAQREAELNFTGGVTQRGQDIGANTARDSLMVGSDLTRRGQDLNASQAMNALLAGLAETEFSGAMAQRSQDIGVNEGRHALEVQRAEAEHDDEQSAINRDSDAVRSLEDVIMSGLAGDVFGGVETMGRGPDSLEALRKIGMVRPVLG